MKTPLIQFKNEKLNNVHPRALLLMLEKMVEKDYRSASIISVEETPIDELNTRLKIEFVCITGEIQPGKNKTTFRAFTCQYGNDFSCSSSHIEQTI